MHVIQNIDGFGLLLSPRGQTLATFSTPEAAWAVCAPICREYERLVALIPSNQLETFLARQERAQ